MHRWAGSSLTGKEVGHESSRHLHSDIPRIQESILCLFLFYHGTSQFIHLITPFRTLLVFTNRRPEGDIDHTRPASAWRAPAAFHSAPSPQPDAHHPTSAPLPRKVPKCLTHAHNPESRRTHTTKRTTTTSKWLYSVAVITPDSDVSSEHSGNPGSIPGTTSSF